MNIIQNSKPVNPAITMNIIAIGSETSISSLFDKYINASRIPSKSIQNKTSILLIIIIFSKISLSKNISFERVNNDISMYLILTLGMDVIVFKIILYNVDFSRA